MDLDLARTFLEVCQTRHFGRAADNLHLTTSAVSARIRSLESELKSRLFIRLHNEIELTDTAKRLIPQFRSLLSLWEQARFIATVESDPAPNLNVMFTPGVWESYDAAWIKHLIASHANLRFRIETAVSSEIFGRLHLSKADLGITIESHSGDDVRSEQIGELELCLYSDTQGKELKEIISNDYIHVDWGTSFTTQFLSVFSEYLNTRITVSTARIAADLLVDLPGSAYFPSSIVEKIKPAVPMQLVQDAPRFRVPVFAVYLASNHKADLIKEAVGAMRTFSFGNKVDTCLAA
jgi:LysR family transcriptional regulator, flagellar master operon regulator